MTLGDNESISLEINFIAVAKFAFPIPSISVQKISQRAKLSPLLRLHLTKVEIYLPISNN